MGVPPRKPGIPGGGPCGSLRGIVGAERGRHVRVRVCHQSQSRTVTAENSSSARHLHPSVGSILDFVIQM